jgi:hypothetical protein
MSPRQHTPFREQTHALWRDRGQKESRERNRGRETSSATTSAPAEPALNRLERHGSTKSAFNGFFVTYGVSRFTQEKNPISTAWRAQSAGVTFFGVSKKKIGFGSSIFNLLQFLGKRGIDCVRRPEPRCVQDDERAWGAACGQDIRPRSTPAGLFGLALSC